MIPYGVEGKQTARIHLLLYTPPVLHHPQTRRSFSKISHLLRRSSPPPLFLPPFFASRQARSLSLSTARPRHMRSDSRAALLRPRLVPVAFFSRLNPKPRHQHLPHGATPSISPPLLPHLHSLVASIVVVAFPRGSSSRSFASSLHHGYTVSRPVPSVLLGACRVFRALPHRLACLNNETDKHAGCTASPRPPGLRPASRTTHLPPRAPPSVAMAPFAVLRATALHALDTVGPFFRLFVASGQTRLIASSSGKQA